MLSLKNKRKSAQYGAALIEFAIVVSLLLVLVIGISEFGYAFYHLDILTKSTEDGARYFSDPLRARQDKLLNDIDVDPLTNGVAIEETRNLIMYGTTTEPPVLPSLLPTAANYSLPDSPPASSFITVVGDHKNHIQVTAVYNHNFLLGNVVNFFGISNPIPLTASSVFRVEGKGE
jgi:hypothetical protein